MLDKTENEFDSGPVCWCGVLLVSSSTEIPSIKDFVKVFWDGTRFEDTYTSVNGAAIYASIVDKESLLMGRRVQYYLFPHNYGVQTKLAIFLCVVKKSYYDKTMVCIMIPFALDDARCQLKLYKKYYNELGEETEILLKL